METNKIYVAIGKEVEERQSILKWALKTFIGNNICVIYVHVPAKRIPLPSGLILPERFIRKKELEAFRAQEKEDVLQLLVDCSQICALFQVPCETKVVEKDSITEGILELIYQLRIEKLVMGAAANNKYWRGMTKVMSEKAKYVLQFAPDFCQVCFICKDRLINKREGVMQQSPIVEELPSQLGYNRRPAKPCRSSTFSDSQSSSAKTRVSNPHISSFADGDVIEQNDDKFSSCVGNLGSSSPSNGSNINGNLCNQLEQAISKSESSWREACRESVSSWNAKKQDMEAFRRAKPVERLYNEELKLNQAMKEEAENMKRMFSKASLELSEALDQKLSLQSQNQQINLKVKVLEEKMFSEMELSQNYKEERDKMQIERDSALEEAQALSEQLAQGPYSSVDPIFSEFSFLELQKATNYFDQSRKIGEGGYGSMYKGFLHHTQVAIKLLDPNIVQNHREFDEQVVCISKLRHPNVVTLMGACREPLALVYEYLPNGSLEDKLIRQNFTTTPLTWQMRVRIAMDICSALIFLHSSRPNCIAQGDLTPLKLLLDANFSCKITDFGIVSKDSTPLNLFITRPFKPELYNCTPANLDSDVYSFGIIVLQLLTGKQATLGLITEVKYSSKIGALETILDPFAGDWPFVQAEQLAHMALRCCDINNNERPDLAADVWRVLAPMRASCSGVYLLPMASRDQPPHYFTCPILQETMEDPHFAADGFTYEAEAIRGWLDSGHDTSPMTNVKLANLNLIPNRALRSVIQEWLQSLHSTST